MTRDSLIALGREFRRRGMTEHVDQLASYYRSNQGNVPPYGWSDAHVEAWAKRLRIPPYDLALEVRPRNQPCPSCGPAGDTHTTCSFPGGWEVTCFRCRVVWLELEGRETTGPDKRSGPVVTQSPR